jgi:hypothetical protein
MLLILNIFFINTKYTRSMWVIEGVFFVNIRYMFNGDRLAFVKEYGRKADKLKNASQTSVLPGNDALNVAAILGG